MATLIYAGIGARATPASVLADMTVMAGWLARTGWHLASGGADGADSPRLGRRPGSGRSGFRGGATTGTGGRSAGRCLRRRCRRAWRSLPLCISPGTGARSPSASCMPGTRRYCFRTPWIGRSMRSFAGRREDRSPAARAWPFVSPRPTASRCSIWARCRRGRPASAWPRSDAPPPHPRAGEERPPGECPAGRRK